MKDKLQDQEKAPEPKYEFWLITRIKSYAKRKPKQAFIAMFSLVVLSVLISIGNLIYVRTVAVPKYNEMKKVNIFKDVGDSFTEPIQATQNVFELKEVMKELDFYRQKEHLTSKDSLRIKYLIDKYSLKSSK